MKKMEIDKIVSTIIKEASRVCQDYATLLREKIPSAACDKNQLVAIVLTFNILGPDKLIPVLELMSNAGYSSQEKYRKILDAVTEFYRKSSEEKKDDFVI